MARTIRIFWRDIPSAVLVQERRTRVRAQLSERFQVAIDRAAMRAGKGSSDAYIAEWRRESEPCDAGGDLQVAADREASRLEALYTDARLAALVRSKGVAT